MNEDTLRAAETWRTRGDAVALATLVRSRRSAPRPLGNKLAISARGEMAGSVSGGCVEGAVFEEAQSVLAGGPSKLLYYGIADDLAWNVGLTCGGEIWVWLEALPRLAGAGRARPRASRSSRATDAGTHLLVTHEGRAAGDLDGDLVDAAVAAGQEAIDRERNATVERARLRCSSPRRSFRRRASWSSAPSTPPSRSAAWPRALGWRTAVVDPRGTFATAERVPSADRLVVRWPGAGYDELERRARGRRRRADARPEARRSRRSPRPSAATSASSARSARAARRRSARARLRESGLTDERARPRLGPGRSRHRRAHAGGDRRLDPRRGHRRARRAATAAV